MVYLSNNYDYYFFFSFYVDPTRRSRLSALIIRVKRPLKTGAKVTLFCRNCATCSFVRRSARCTCHMSVRACVLRACVCTCVYVHVLGLLARVYMVFGFYKKYI